MRRRLILSIAAVAAVAVVLFAVPLALVVGAKYRGEELLRLQRDTVAATRATDLGAGGDPVELPRTSDRLAVYDLAGRRHAGRGPARADATVRAAVRSGRLTADTHGDRLVVAVPLLQGERVSGALRAQRSDAAAARDMRGAWLGLAALAAVLVGLAVLAAVVLGRALARPLERLADAARRDRGGGRDRRCAGRQRAPPRRPGRTRARVQRERLAPAPHAARRPAPRAGGDAAGR